VVLGAVDLFAEVVGMVHKLSEELRPVALFFEGLHVSGSSAFGLKDRHLGYPLRFGSSPISNPSAVTVMVKQRLGKFFQNLRAGMSSRNSTSLGSAMVFIAK